VPAEILKWVLARGIVMRGLVLRRQAETALI
jgi:GH24 family phage-related lysozyme (muramidase)